MDINKPKVTLSIALTENGYIIAANGANITTPAGNEWLCPSEQLTIIASEQIQQHGSNSQLYRLISLMIDMQRTAITDELLSFFDTDLVCYYAKDPKDLVKWQQTYWSPILQWAKSQKITPLRTTTDTMPITHSKTAHDALEAYLDTLDDNQIVTASVASKLSSSVLTGLAFTAGILTAESAHNIAHADEYYQQDRYGEDELLTERLEENLTQFKQLQQFRDAF